MFEELKNRLTLSDFIKEATELKPAGPSKWKGCCPFHKERTPSFFVFDDKASFHCFGCNERGDIITFFQKYHGLDFINAVKKLHEIAGLPLPDSFLKFSPNKTPVDTVAQDLLQRISSFFEECLKNETLGFEARTYLKSRGIDCIFVPEFKLGYCPPGKILMEKISANTLINKAQNLGIINSNGYSNYQNRIIFPILDDSEKVVGFGARVFLKNDDGPKYLNSKESSLFQKKNLFYLWSEAQKKLRNFNFIIVTEGYLDAIAGNLGGIPTIASLGTALSEHQVLKLKKTGKKIIFFYDNDSPGKVALERTLKICLKEGVIPYAINWAKLPSNIKDLHDLYLQHPHQLTQLDSLSVNAIDLLADQVLGELKTKTIAEKIEGLKLLKELVKDSKEESIKINYLIQWNNKLGLDSAKLSFAKSKMSTNEHPKDENLLLISLVAEYKRRLDSSSLSFTWKDLETNYSLEELYCKWSEKNTVPVKVSNLSDMNLKHWLTKELIKKEITDLDTILLDTNPTITKDSGNLVDPELINNILKRKVNLNLKYQQIKSDSVELT